MPYRIETSRFSFVQFAELDTIGGCNWSDTDMCLPVFHQNDAWFQFVIAADTEEEADDLCTLDSNAEVGIIQNCFDPMLLTFEEKPTRYRISPTRILYVWQHGVPGFESVLDVGECFHIRVNILLQSFCSNCFQRIGDDCHTSVIEYTNTDNAFGFNYCTAANSQQEGDDQVCEPIEIPFINQATMIIPWTAFLSDRYGDLPSVEVWVFQDGELIKPGIVAELDNYPPSEIRIDFGGISSGIVKIM